MPAGSGDRRRRDWARAIAVECPDLLAVGGLALAGVAVVLVPTLAPLRPVVRLAFLLVAPGYATTVPLFPVPSARATDRATPTRLERAALTVAGGAVLAGTFAIGATLAAFRLTPGRAVGALAAWTLAAAGVGAWRRMRARGDRPRAIVDRIQAAVSRARESRLAVALVVLTVVAAGAAGALVTVDFRPDPYTKLEFVDELRVSPEGATTYTLLVVGQRAIRAGEGVRIERTRRFAARSRSLPAGERWRVSIAGPVEDGTTRVAVHLYVDRSPAEGAPDARLHAWLPRDGASATAT